MLAVDGSRVTSRRVREEWMSNERRHSALTSGQAEVEVEAWSRSSVHERLAPAASRTRQQRPRPQAGEGNSRVRHASPLSVDAVCLRLRRFEAEVYPQRAPRSAVLLREADELLALLEQPEVEARLLEVGLEPARFEELSWCVQAVDVLERAIRMSLSEASARARALQVQALEVRDELLSACQWNLRQVDAAEALARITNSASVDELVLDLRELARLITQHSAAFRKDRSFIASAQAERAARLAEGLLSSVRQGLLQMNEDLLPVVDGARARLGELMALQVQACGWLSALLREVRAAGCYAYRAEPDARRWFMEPHVPRGSRLTLTALVARG